MSETIKSIPIVLPETGNWKYPNKTLKLCPRCGEHFLPRSPRAIYCEDCRYEHELEKARERAQKYRKTGRKAELAKNTTK